MKPIICFFFMFCTAALETYGKVREKARLLLHDGKKQEAVTLLNATASAIWLDAEKTPEL